jgi:hypothetical protein
VQRLLRPRDVKTTTGTYVGKRLAAVRVTFMAGLEVGALIVLVEARRR